MEKLCLVCGKKFLTQPYLIKKGYGKYCSLQCFAKTRIGETKNFECPICKEVFSLRLCDIKNGRGKYCSRKCQYIGISKIRRGKNHHQWNRVEKECENCGKLFHAFPSKINIDQGKYCSRKCVNQVRKKFFEEKRVDKKCLICGKEFKITQSRAYKFNRGKCCSEKCRNQYVIKLLYDRQYIRPNKLEKSVALSLNKTFPKEWKYVGNGKVWFGGKNPDFININGQKKLIEVYGNYWHKGENPQGRIDHFKQYGFDTLVLWEKEILDTNYILKVATFLKGGT